MAHVHRKNTAAVIIVIMAPRDAFLARSHLPPLGHQADVEKSGVAWFGWRVGHQLLLSKL